jgi:hypothetical protein
MNTRIILQMVGLPLCVALLFSGCEKQEKTANKGAPGDNKPIIPEPGPPTAAAHVQRGKERQINQNDLRQLALFFKQIKTLQADNRPVTKDELKAEIQRDMPKLWQAIDEGKIIVNYNCDGSSNSLLAHEQKADLNGNHLVTMGDGSTKLVPSAQLQQIVPKQ